MNGTTIIPKNSFPLSRNPDEPRPIPFGIFQPNPLSILYFSGGLLTPP